MNAARLRLLHGHYENLGTCPDVQARLRKEDVGFEYTPAHPARPGEVIVLHTMSLTDRTLEQEVRRLVATKCFELLPEQQPPAPEEPSPADEDIRPIKVAMTEDGGMRVVDGHHRLKAALELGIEPNIVVDTTSGEAAVTPPAVAVLDPAEATPVTDVKALAETMKELADRAGIVMTADGAAHAPADEGEPATKAAGDEPSHADA